jgi:hypothetical protein
MFMKINRSQSKIPESYRIGGLFEKYLCERPFAKGYYSNV